VQLPHKFSAQPMGARENYSTAVKNAVAFMGKQAHFTVEAQQTYSAGAHCLDLICGLR
jgi:hypothetical protein